MKCLYEAGKYLTYLTEQDTTPPYPRATIIEVPPAASECSACERPIEKVVELELIMGDWYCSDCAEHFYDPLP